MRTSWPGGAMPPRTSEQTAVGRVTQADSTRYGKPLVHFDAEAEAKLRWKIDLMIVPTVAVLYCVCFIDRANIGA